MNHVTRSVNAHATCSTVNVQNFECLFFVCTQVKLFTLYEVID